MPPRPPPPPDTPVPAPTKPNLDACRRCELWEKATQAVPGGGSKKPAAHARRRATGRRRGQAGCAVRGAGGPAAAPGDRDAGLTLDEIYLTNAVKHFYWEPRGPRRIHKTPAQRHIDACRAWLEKEIAKAKPLVIVTLGSTALNGVMGGKMKVGDAREDNLKHASGAPVVATYHPSAALRVPDKDARAQMYATIVERPGRMAATCPRGTTTRLDADITTRAPARPASPARSRASHRAPTATSAPPISVCAMLCCASPSTSSRRGSWPAQMTIVSTSSTCGLPSTVMCNPASSIFTYSTPASIFTPRFLSSVRRIQPVVFARSFADLRRLALKQPDFP